MKFLQILNTYSIPANGFTHGKSDLLCDYSYSGEDNYDITIKLDRLLLTLCPLRVVEVQLISLIVFLASTVQLNKSETLQFCNHIIELFCKMKMPHSPLQQVPCGVLLPYVINFIVEKHIITIYVNTMLLCNLMMANCQKQKIKQALHFIEKNTIIPKRGKVSKIA